MDKINLKILISTVTVVIISFGLTFFKIEKDCMFGLCFYWIIPTFSISSIPLSWALSRIKALGSWNRLTMLVTFFGSVLLIILSFIYFQHIIASDKGISLLIYFLISKL